MPDQDVVYRSVRQEILDQKRCQFQIFGAALTLSSAVLGYAALPHIGAFVYAAPMVMNVLTLTVILDKAVSIQRMVGYLQLMESTTQPPRGWMWEYHLNIFRELKGRSVGSEEHRKHVYIRSVSMILLLLNLVFFALYFWNADDVTPRNAQASFSVARLLGSVDSALIVLNVFGVYFAINRIWRLVHGPMTSRAVRHKWIVVFAEADARLNPGGTDGPPLRGAATA